MSARQFTHCCLHLLDQRQDLIINFAELRLAVLRHVLPILWLDPFRQLQTNSCKKLFMSNVCTCNGAFELNF